MEQKTLLDFINFENKNREQVMLDLIKAYYEDAYFDEDNENLYNLFDREDANRFIAIYQFDNYIKAINNAKYVIAGLNLKFDEIIYLKSDDYSINNFFLDIIIHEIDFCVNNMKNNGVTTEEISKSYPHIDFLGYFDERMYRVSTIKIKDGQVLFETYCKNLHKDKNDAMKEAKQLVHQNFYSFFDSDDNESIKIIKEDDSFALTIQPDNIRYIFAVIEVDIRDNN